MTSARGEAVVELVGPGLPADRGLASLALLMQLGGGVSLVSFAALAVVPVVAGWDGSFTWFFLAILGAGRGALHRHAGTSLLYGADDQPLRGVFGYLAGAAIHTAITGFLLHRAGMAAGDLVALVTLLLAWPIALLVVLHPRAATSPARSGLIYSEDFGFEGTAVLMAVLGSLGIGVAIIGLGLFLEHPSTMLGSPARVVVVVILAMMLVRSGFQAWAGYRGTAGADFDTANRAASRYYDFGVVSAVLIAIAGFVGLFLRTGVGPALWSAATIAGLLLVWPVTLRRFFGERGFTVTLAGPAMPVFRRAPDAGLTTLGWFLLAIAVISLASALPAALGIADLGSLEPPGAVSVSRVRSEWWSVGVAGLQMWAAIELCSMSPRHKLAAYLYGVVGLLVALHVTWPLVAEAQGALDGLAGFATPLILRLVIFAHGAFALVAALATIILVSRAELHDAVVLGADPQPANKD